MVIIADAEIDEEIRFEAQDIPLDIVYEDDDILLSTNHAIWWYIPARAPGRYGTERVTLLSADRMFRARALCIVWIRTRRADGGGLNRSPRKRAGGVLVPREITPRI